MIRFCKHHDLVIIGMEGFTTDGSSIIPTLDFIADFGDVSGDWHERVQASNAAAILVAARWAELDGFEFVAMEAIADQQ